MAVLKTIQLRKVFGQGDTQVEALKGIDLEIQAGEYVAIMGRSGSGKSTLLSQLGGVDTPSSGQVLLEGKDLAAMTDDERTLLRRRRIGFIFQAFNLLPILTALENVALPLELDGIPARTAKERASKLLTQVGLGERMTHLPGALSGGEQQRVAVARALAIEPAILLADEPTGNLDSATGEKLTGILRQLVDKEGQTIVLVTHDPKVAELADRIIYVVDGRVASEEGEPPRREAKAKSSANGR